MSNRRLTEKEKKWLVGGGVVLFLLLSGLVCWFAGRPLIRFMNQPELFRQWVDQQGFWAPVAFVGMVVLQVVVAVIPGEPLEIAAGYAFGALEGTLLCILGTWIGGLTVFLLVRRFGTRAVEVFFPLEKLNELKFLKNERRLTFWVFLVFFLPGTPKDVLCYFVGLTKLPLKTWVLVSAVARDAVGMQNYTFAAAVFAATLVISGAGLLLYRAICRRQEEGGGAQ